SITTPSKSQLIPYTTLFRSEYTERYQSLSNMFYEDKSRLDGKTPVWYWYYMNTGNKILFQNDSLLSYAVEYSDYEGGAHGSYRIDRKSTRLNSSHVKISYAV